MQDPCGRFVEKFSWPDLGKRSRESLRRRVFWQDHCRRSLYKVLVEALSRRCLGKISLGDGRRSMIFSRVPPSIPEIC